MAGGTSTLGDMARMTPATTTEAGLKVADTTAAAQGLGIAGTKTPNVSDAVLRQAPGIGVKPDPFSLITNKATLAGAAGPALGLPPIMPQFKKDEGPEPPEGMAPVGKPRKAPIGFDPGKEGEFDYRIPRNFQEGGLASLEMDATEMNDKELINKAIDAIQNELPNPEEVLGVFIARFGEEALADLVRKVQDGTFDDTVERSEYGF